MRSSTADKTTEHQERPSEEIPLDDVLPTSLARTIGNTKEKDEGESFQGVLSNKSEEKDKLQSPREETIKIEQEVNVK